MGAIQRRQCTLKSALEFAGVGIHSGKSGKVRLLPASPNTGRVFKVGQSLIPAVAENVVSTVRSTVLGIDEKRISTVEHLLAALFALHVDNAIIEFDGVEVPILDGSAWPFAREILRVGLEEQAELVTYLQLCEPRFVAHNDALVLAMPSETLSFEASVSYPGTEVGAWQFTYDETQDFATAIAPARTFGFWSEVQQLLAAGLGLGGDLSNALIFDCPPGTIPADVRGDELAEKAGFITASGVKMRFADEAVRHKLLDFLGDMALIGRPVCARFVAIRAGHSLHVQLAKKLRRELLGDGW